MKVLEVLEEGRRYSLWLGILMLKQQHDMEYIINIDVNNEYMDGDKLIYTVVVKTIYM